MFYFLIGVFCTYIFIWLTDEIQLYFLRKKGWSDILADKIEQQEEYITHEDAIHNEDFEDELEYLEMLKDIKSRIDKGK